MTPEVAAHEKNVTSQLDRLLGFKFPIRPIRRTETKLVSVQIKLDVGFIEHRPLRF